MITLVEADKGIITRSSDLDGEICGSTPLVWPGCDISPVTCCS